MPNTPASLPRYDDASSPPQASHASQASPDSARPSSPPPSGTGGPLTFGTTRKDFGAPKLSAREKAKRNVLTHTLQMPLVVTPMPPTAASAPDAHRRMTLQGGAQPPGAAQSAGAALPAGWTSMHRVGSGAPPEPSSARPVPRSTVPLHSARPERNVYTEPTTPSAGSDTRRVDQSERFQREREPIGDSNRPEPGRAHPTLQDAPPFAWQQGGPPPPELPRWSERPRLPEYERETMPESMPIRIPSLSVREWLFIALLACASAATLYSLLIDDVTNPIEDDAEAVTGAAPEHVVTPAPLPPVPEKSQAKPASPAAPAAASANLTEIVSEPAQAEIVVGGAVIGNTPAHVVRGDKDADYLLRKPGYEPQLVRVTPHSPKIITITLHAKQ
jgi:hypothetical protein